MDLIQEANKWIINENNHEDESIVGNINKHKFYHGTNTKFDNFDKKFLGSQTDIGLYGRGFYFANSEFVARRAIQGGAKYVLVVKLKVKNPLDVARYTKKELSDYLDLDEYIFTGGGRRVVRPTMSYIGNFTSSVKDKGHDSVYVNRGGVSDEICVFNSNDIEIIEII